MQRLTIVLVLTFWTLQLFGHAGCMLHTCEHIEFRAAPKTVKKNVNYPTDYFRSPINGQLRLSGSFGELRPNHFHAGIDIKSTIGGAGQAIIAAADGYVARVKVQAGGYGNAIYLRHPNGYTTVYAHLSEFAPELAAYVKEQQYARQSFSVDLYPSAGQISFKKGDRIGKLGNSGSSRGPHLHFEIRDSGTEEPINPLLFGLKISDTQAPRLHQIRVYALNGERETLDARSYDIQKGKTRHYIKGDTVYVGADKAGFALKAYDHMNGVTNWNGVYRISMLVDEQPWYEFTAERFAFHQTRGINAHMDYEERVTKKSNFNRCYLLPGNKLPFYDNLINKGVVQLSSERASKITMITEDISGNTSTLVFWAKASQTQKAVVKRRFNYVLPYDSENAIDNGAMYFYFPKQSLYETLYLDYRSSSDFSENVHSDVHHVHNRLTPLHKYCDIAIQPTTLPKHLRDKAFIAKCDKKSSITNMGNKWKDGRLWGKTRNFGDFCIMVDTIPPSIKPQTFQANMRGKNRMTFRIDDNYATGGGARGLDYRATVDGQWILMEYDAKNDRLIHRFDERIPAGKHELRLVVTDAVGNRREYEATFTR